jgi:hypothetical protein
LGLLEALTQSEPVPQSGTGIEPGVDVRGRLLRSYYPVLEIGRRILDKYPDADRALAGVLDSVSIPAPLRGDLYAAVGLPRIEPEPATSIGNSVFIGQLASEAPFTAKDLFDDTIQRSLFGLHIKGVWPRDLAQFLTHVLSRSRMRRRTAVGSLALHDFASQR